MNEEVIARIVRSDGSVLTADETVWGLTGIDGAAAPEYEIFSEKNATGDGDTVTGKRVAARSLELTAEVMNPGQNSTLRKNATSFFNPKHSFSVYLTYQGVTRWLSAELEAFKMPSLQIDIPQAWTAFFLAASPYWQSVDDFNQDLASRTPRWGFPYMEHPQKGVLADASNFSRRVEFTYNGDAPAYPSIIIKADSIVTNPKIVKDGFYVRLLDTLAAGDVVVITTSPRAVGITKNGQNVLNKVDRTSRFSDLRMSPGVNTVQYEADYGDNNLHVTLRYNEQYLGV